MCIIAEMLHNTEIVLFRSKGQRPWSERHKVQKHFKQSNGQREFAAHCVHLLLHRKR